MRGGRDEQREIKDVKREVGMAEEKDEGLVWKYTEDRCESAEEEGKRVFERKKGERNGKEAKGPEGEAARQRRQE